MSFWWSVLKRRKGRKEPEADTPWTVSWSIQGNLGKCESLAVRGQDLGRTELNTGSREENKGKDRVR